jgi:hypothetical protein
VATTRPSTSQGDDAVPTEGDDVLPVHSPRMWRTRCSPRRGILDPVAGDSLPATLRRLASDPQARRRLGAEPPGVVTR